jgi:hypothetical protein
LVFFSRQRSLEAADHAKGFERWLKERTGGWENWKHSAGKAELGEAGFFVLTPPNSKDELPPSFDGDFLRKTFAM